MSMARPLALGFLVAGIMPADLLDAGSELVDGINLGRPAWHTTGACRRPEHTGVNFFPGRGESAAPAKAVWPCHPRACASCRRCDR